jgi:hypothetical protein
MLREDLDLDRDDDPVAAAEAVGKSAAELDAWDGGGRPGARPPGRLRYHVTGVEGGMPVGHRWFTAPTIAKLAKAKTSGASAPVARQTSICRALKSDKLSASQIMHATTSPHRRSTSLGWPGTSSPTARSAHSFSSAAAPWSGISGRCTRSSASPRDGSFTRVAPARSLTAASL